MLKDLGVAFAGSPVRDSLNQQKERKRMKKKTSKKKKQFDLTPGDSRDYLGIRVRVVSVDARKEKPIVTVCITPLEELERVAPTADPKSDSEQTTE